MSQDPAFSTQKTPDKARPSCSVCGLTAAELRDTGRMGCARCYDTFADMVAQAAKELHGQDTGATAAPPPTEWSDPTSLPWPTRRAATVSPTPAMPRPKRKR